MKSSNKILVGFLAFAMYFLTGAACVMVGSSMPQLVEMYHMPISKVVILGSAYALGRILTVLITGKMVEKLGSLKVLFAGVFLTGVFLAGVPTFQNFYAGLVFTFIGGVGMGSQDATTPVLLSYTFSKKAYDGSLSGGQGIFGVGTFVAPFLIGVFLKGKLPFYLSYYVLAAFAVLMLILIPFARIDRNSSSTDEKENETVKPLYTKNAIVSYISIFVVVFAFSALSSALGLYIAAFAQSIGVSASNAAFMFTVYNIGCVIGGFVFMIVLRFIKSQTVLMMNCACAFVAIAVALMINKPQAYFVCLFIAGLFLGVLFSVIVAISTRIGYKHMSIASSLVATASGAGDFLTPMITGAVVASFGLKSAFTFSLAMLAICVVSALILKMDTTEELTVNAE